MDRNLLVTNKYWVILVIVLIALIAAIGMGYGKWWGTPKMEVMKTIQNFELDELDGKKFQFDATKGKVKLVSFIFTRCPDVCPVTTHYMSQMQEELKAKGLFGKEVDFVTITFDYENDTPEVLQKYAAQYHADLSGWHFLRGEEARMKKVTSEFWFGAEKTQEGSYIHTMKTYLVDKENNLRKTYGMAAEMDQREIIKDIVHLTKE